MVELDLNTGSSGLGAFAFSDYTILPVPEEQCVDLLLSEVLPLFALGYQKSRSLVRQRREWEKQSTSDFISENMLP